MGGNTKIQWWKNQTKKTRRQVMVKKSIPSIKTPRVRVKKSLGYLDELENTRFNFPSIGKNLTKCGECTRIE